MKKKGFTLIELLVVISIIALLMAILMPALSKVRQIAQRVVCGHHLSGLGNAIELYATDHQGKYPRAGGRYSVWGESILKWNGGIPPQQNTEDIAYGVAPGVPPGRPATIGSCLFLLIKYTDASPRQFVCGGDNTATVFNLADYPVGTVRNNDVMEAWDFGGRPDGTSDSPNVEERSHYSYAYQMPFHGLLGTSYITYPLNSLSDSSMAIMADKNPYLVNTPDSGWALQMYWWKGIGGSKQDERWGNSPNHVMEGQNVLFNDGHVTFHDVPYCGVDDDNIYSITSSLFAVETGLEPWPPPLGTTTSVTVFPNSKIDSLLINEGIQCKDGPQGTAIVPE